MSREQEGFHSRWCVQTQFNFDKERGELVYDKDHPAYLEDISASEDSAQRNIGISGFLRSSRFDEVRGFVSSGFSTPDKDLLSAYNSNLIRLVQVGGKS